MHTQKRKDRERKQTNKKKKNLKDKKLIGLERFLFLCSISKKVISHEGKSMSQVYKN